MSPHPQGPSDDPGADAEPVRFAVPEDLRAYAPDGAAVAAVDPRTLAVAAVAPTDATADGPTPDGASLDDPPFDRVHPAFPTGRAGVATALLLRSLESLALRREAAVALVDAAEAAGGDPLLALDRLADDPDLDPVVDLARRRRQLAEFLS